MSLQERLLKLGSKQHNKFRKCLKLTRFTRLPLPPILHKQSRLLRDILGLVVLPRNSRSVKLPERSREQPRCLKEAQSH